MERYFMANVILFWSDILLRIKSCKLKRFLKIAPKDSGIIFIIIIIHFIIIIIIIINI